MAGAKPARLREDVRQRGACLERRLRGPLDHRAVRQRVAERHAQLQHVGTLIAQRRSEAVRFVEVGISGREEGNERAARDLAGGLERAADPAGHVQPLSAAARR